MLAKKGPNRIVYQETLISAANVMAFTFFTMILLYGMFLQEGAEPGLLSYFLLGFMILAGVNFSKLSIMITTGGIIVGFGFLKQVLSWNQITACSIDPVPSVGWLIQLSAHQGKHRVGYHVFGKRKIKLAARGVWLSELSFSTREPEHVLEILTKGDGEKGQKKR